MYTLTVKIAAGGTTYTKDGVSHPSAFGHMQNRGQIFNLHFLGTLIA